MKILIVLPRFPYPLEKGDKLRAYHQIKYLAKHNEVYLFCISHQRVDATSMQALEPYCKRIEVVYPCRVVSCKNVVRNYLWSKSLQLGYWDSTKARKAYKAFEAEVQPDVLYNQMVRTMTFVARSAVPKVMDYQDALSMNIERRMEATRPGLWHHLLHFEFKMLRSSEYNAFKIFDALTIISEPDDEAIPHTRNGVINIVPNGVDTDYFAPTYEPKQYDIMFCGNMQYAPNIDAAQYLVKEVLPLVRVGQTPLRVLIAGAEPTLAVRRLACSGVEVTGWVDDMRRCYAQSTVFVAPMRLGSGLQNKLLEAMSMQLPCVTTPLANASLGAEPGQHALVADTAQGLADHISRLLTNAAERERIASQGRQFVVEHYNWDSVGAKLEQILTKAAKR